MEVNIIPNFRKNDGGPDPTPKALHGGPKRCDPKKGLTFFQAIVDLWVPK